ncbi:hypothetical protein [uncultured Abiotrophia sp.]|uniref:hypothetical protein n=1 Tax=uncultured Abiotrophia sp. TaxID=316094 RepID=UPI0028E8EBF0|nr:hypothetical protein [uncultured Abiotrophia sp.]
MEHEKEDERGKVIKWLEYCDTKQIKPWEWDFKNCYTDSLPEDDIAAFLQYKSGTFTNPNSFCITQKSGSKADCDKEAIGLYQVLGWQNSAKDIIRGETMNSFLTTFNRAIRQSSNYSTLTKTLGIDNRKKERYSKLCENQNYQQFKIIENNPTAFQTFAGLTHTIGNFTVLPHWMNTGRSNLSQDYWDIFLLSLQEWLHLISPTSEAWINFIELYYLQPYVNKDYQIEPLWKNHSYTTPILKEKEDFPIFLKAVNERIEERGKYMIKQICDRLNRTDFNFYKEIRDMDKIRFSDEF